MDPVGRHDPGVARRLGQASPVLCGRLHDSRVLFARSPFGRGGGCPVAEWGQLGRIDRIGLAELARRADEVVAVEDEQFAADRIVAGGPVAHALADRTPLAMRRRRVQLGRVLRGVDARSRRLLKVGTRRHRPIRQRVAQGHALGRNRGDEHAAARTDRVDPPLRRRTADGVDAGGRTEQVRHWRSGCKIDRQRLAAALHTGQRRPTAEKLPRDPKRGPVGVAADDDQAVPDRMLDDLAEPAAGLHQNADVRRMKREQPPRGQPVRVGPDTADGVDLFAVEAERIDRGLEDRASLGVALEAREQVPVEPLKPQDELVDRPQPGPDGPGVAHLVRQVVGFAGLREQELPGLLVAARGDRIDDLAADLGPIGPQIGHTVDDRPAAADLAGRIRKHPVGGVAGEHKVQIVPGDRTGPRAAERGRQPGPPLGHLSRCPTGGHQAASFQSRPPSELGSPNTPPSASRRTVSAAPAEPGAQRATQRAAKANARMESRGQSRRRGRKNAAAAGRPASRSRPVRDPVYVEARPFQRAAVT